MLDDTNLNTASGTEVSGFCKGEAYPSIGSQIWCKDCRRRDYHFLNFRSGATRFIVKTFSLGLIGLVGTYRCRCCGNKRIGRFDFFRGPQKPKRSTTVRIPRKDSDSFKVAQRRDQRSTFLQKINPLYWYLTRHDSWKAVHRRSRIQRFLKGFLPGRKKSNRRFKKRRNW